MKRIYKFLPVLMMVFMLAGCTAALAYSETVHEGPWEAALYRDGKEAFVSAYEWDGTEEGLRIEPDEVDGCEVIMYGGFFGRGLPMPFDIIIPDAVFVGESDIPADAEVEDLTFTMVISEKILKVYVNDLEGFFYMEEEDGSLKYYRLLVDVELDPDNKELYMKDGKLYQKYDKEDVEITGVSVESVENFDPENREAAPSDEDEDETADIDWVYGDELQFSDGRYLETYSSDGSVLLIQDYLGLKSVIHDGDLEIPVDIAFGVYGPFIEKFDTDGDGEDEYLIAECEGSGTGYCVYGLVIVRKDGDEYFQSTYDGKFFSDYIKENVGFDYNEKTREVIVFEILPMNFNRYEGVTIKLDREAALKDIVWSDIIRVGFENERVLITAPSGYIYEDSPMPDYEQAALVELGLFFYEDGSFEVFVNDISEDDGEK